MLTVWWEADCRLKRNGKSGSRPNGNKYPWGNEAPNCHLANYNQGTYENPTYCVGDTSEVAPIQKRSYYGAMDMAGNIWEWVNDFGQTI